MLPGFLRRNAEVCVEERSEAIELVEPVKQAKEQINRQCHHKIATAAAPELIAPGALKQKHQQDKNPSGQ